MTSKAKAYVFAKLKDQVLGDFAKYFTPGDAFYYEDPETGKRKRKKKKKYLIDGVSPEDLAVLDEVRSRAWALEMCLMRCCGFNIGWVAVLGLIPILGDVLCFLLAVRIIRKAAEIEGGLPSWLRSQMYFYAAIDAAGESIPFFGAIWGSIYKANTRNTWLLEDYLTKKAKKGAARGGVHEGDVEMGLAGPPRQPQQPLRQPKQTHKNGRR